MWKTSDPPDGTEWCLRPMWADLVCRPERVKGSTRWRYVFQPWKTEPHRRDLVDVSEPMHGHAYRNLTLIIDKQAHDTGYLVDVSWCFDVQLPERITEPRAGQMHRILRKGGHAYGIMDMWVYLEISAATYGAKWGRCDSGVVLLPEWLKQVKQEVTKEKLTR